jgi:hypothetical protein
MTKSSRERDKLMINLEQMAAADYASPGLRQTKYAREADNRIPTEQF